MWLLLIGFQQSRKRPSTGDHIDAEEALRLGLVNGLVPEDRPDAWLDELAAGLAAGARRAIGSTRLAITHTLRVLAQGTTEAGFGWETLSQTTADHAEAVEPSADRRAPVSRGR